MIDQLPSYINLVFALTTVLTLWLVYRTIRSSILNKVRQKRWLITGVMIIWLTGQAVLSINQIYRSNLDAFPPGIMLGILPALLIIVTIFVTKRGRAFIDSLPLKNITYINIVRIPVELVLWWLFINKAVPKMMTFEGSNFDILSGLTAPIIGYIGFSKGTVNKPLLLVWNFICLGLLLNVVIRGLLSVPTPSQQFAFDQPNIAVLYFPFIWLPTFIVPVVFFGHLTSIRRCLR